MKHRIDQMARGAFLLLGLFVLTSCSNDSKPKPTAAAPRYDAAVTTQPGVAGGTYEDSFIIEAMVTGVDLPTRHVKLKDSEGDEYNFTARPEVQNLAQLHVGDKVTATFARRLVITVRSDNTTEPSSTYSKPTRRMQVGDKPKMLTAEETKKVARITAIDATNRTADLQFVDGIIQKVPVRSDVDMSQYNGDNVMIR